MVVSKSGVECVWLAVSACLSGIHIGSGAKVVWWVVSRGPCLSAGWVAEALLLAHWWVGGGPVFGANGGSSGSGWPSGNAVVVVVASGAIWA